MEKGESELDIEMVVVIVVFVLVGYGETQSLWKHIEPYFRTVMSRIYLREMAFTDLDCISPPSSSLLELPFFSKYLLLASFLASYNPTRTDRHFFSKVNYMIVESVTSLIAFN